MSDRLLIRCYVLLLLLAFGHSLSLAEPYLNKTKRFSIYITAPWTTATIPDPTAELFLRCEPTECGPKVLLSFGAIFDENFKTGTLADFLKYTNGTSITQKVRDLPMVAKVKLVREGPRKIGKADGYEVLSEITDKDGRKRMRHTFITFNAGYIYSINLGCPPDAYEHALAAAKPILASFRAN